MFVFIRFSGKNKNKIEFDVLLKIILIGIDILNDWWIKLICCFMKGIMYSVCMFENNCYYLVVS